VRGQEQGRVSRSLRHGQQASSHVPRRVLRSPDEVKPSECQQDRKQTGGIVHLLAQLADGARVKVVTAAGDEFPEGAAVGLDFARPDVYVFHPESKKIICSTSDAPRRLDRLICLTR
jgi:hypothetical protein